jgi:hypothetical protein
MNVHMLLFLFFQLYELYVVVFIVKKVNACG